jgi:hypothetical protein
MSNPSLRSIGVVFAVVACLFVSVAAVDASPCVSRGGGCQATVTFTPYSGTPTIPCPVWGTVYTITVSFQCSPFGDPIVETDLVCSETSSPVQFDVNGHTHIFYPDNPSNWGDVVSDCSNLNHKVN